MAAPGDEMPKKRSNEKQLIEALERSMLCSALLLDAIFELLVERGILTGEEVLLRIKQLKKRSASERFRLN